MSITCPQCQHKNPDDTEFCENCGSQLVAPTLLAVPEAPHLEKGPGIAGQTGVAADSLTCPSCKAPYAVGDIFCFNCGNDLSNLAGNQPPAQPVPTPVSPANSGNPPGLTLEGSPPGTGIEAGEGKTKAPVVPNPVPPPGASLSDWDKSFNAQPNSGSFSNEPSSVPGISTSPKVPPEPALEPSSGPVAPAPAGNAFGALPVQVNSQEANPDKLEGNLTLHVVGPNGDEKLEYKGEEILLGRLDTKTRVFPQLNLDDAAASRRHLMIWKEPAGTFFAQDLESSNGTVLNGKDMEPGAPVELKNGDVIKIGTRYSIQVKMG